MKSYMNLFTGSVDTYEGWNCQDIHGKEYNAVDTGEVVEVVKDSKGDWVEAAARGMRKGYLERK